MAEDKNDAVMPIFNPLPLRSLSLDATLIHRLDEFLNLPRHFRASLYKAGKYPSRCTNAGRHSDSLNVRKMVLNCFIQ